ncbi:MAG: MATE family efflux transporter [Lachnospiraceae bacterium]|jgi:putative MATE family efflux protein|nr:MATE family efflux transporter [Lachnospiraceae bacterium]
MANNKQRLIDGAPGRALFLFALPMILGNLFQQFYNMADSVIVGRYVGVDALAAVGASYSFTNVFIMIAIGGGIGASVLTSQYLGARKYQEMKTSVYTFLITFAVLSTLLALFGFVANPWVLSRLNTPENIYEDAVLYLQLYFTGLPFMFMYNILAANFNAMGKSGIPLGLLIFSSLLNIFLDLLMVIRFELGVAGVAIATVLAQGISAVISFCILMALLHTYHTEEKPALFCSSILLRGTKIAVPSIIQQSIVSIGMLLTQSSVNQFGSSALAGYSAGMRLESIAIVPMIGTGNAMSTFTAQNLGAGQTKRVRQGYRISYGIIAGFAIALFVICQAFYHPILSAFLDANASPIAYETGTSYLRFIGCFFCLIGFKATTDGVLRGSGDVGIYMIANLINLGIRVFVARFFSPIYGIQFVWYAVPIGWAVNYLISFCWYQTGHWKTKQMVK